MNFMNGIILSAFFRILLYFLKIICVRFIHICLCNSTQLPVKNIPTFTHFTADRHFHCFRYLVIMKNSAINTHAPASCSMCTRSSVRYRLTRAAAGPWGLHILNFSRKCQTVFQKSYINLYSHKQWKDYCYPLIC